MLLLLGLTHKLKLEQQQQQKTNKKLLKNEAVWEKRWSRCLDEKHKNGEKGNSCCIFFFLLPQHIKSYKRLKTLCLHFVVACFLGSFHTFPHFFGFRADVSQYFEISACFMPCMLFYMARLEFPLAQTQKSCFCFMYCCCCKDPIWNFCRASFRRTKFEFLEKGAITLCFLRNIACKLKQDVVRKDYCWWNASFFGLPYIHPSS